MNRIDRTFAKLREANKKALIAFITAGDPDLETTEHLVLAMEKAGVDIIELGVPFSDPVAEGPVIQASSERALKSGTNLNAVFASVKKLREKTDLPLLLMLYLNSIYLFGTERFFLECAKSGVDGVIVPDMPFEERDEIAEEAKKNIVYSISLVAPTSKERIAMIAPQSTGFLYCVSSLGVTGQRSSFGTDFEGFFSEIRQHASIPAALGFGISSPEQVRALKGYCDAIIVGSAIVKIVEQHGRESVEPVARFVAELKAALE